MRFLFRLIFFIAPISTVFSQKSDFYSKYWSNVYKHELKDLPQSALDVVDSIYTKAKLDKNTPELVKSLIYQSKFAIHLQENAEIRVVNKFKEEIEHSERPLRNLLESLLANIYWEYLKQNRWKYYQRSRTTAIVNQDDFTTWDADAMFTTIHHHFQNSLKNASALQDLQLEFINEVLIQADNSKKYRPTLYDFLVHNAIDFYSTNESSITKPSNEFKVDSDKYFFEFEALDFQDPDTLSPIREALLLYRDLLTFHKQRGDTAAYVNLEIERLNLVANQRMLDQSTRLHQQALFALRDKFKSHSASALVIFKIASLLHKEGGEYVAEEHIEHQFKKAEALSLCNEAIAAFPDSDGAKKCLLLKELILHQEFTIMAEKHIPIRTPSFISIRYTNVDSLYFKVLRVSADLEQRLNDSHRSDSPVWKELADLPAVEQWRVKLKSVKDYQPHTTEVVLPGLSQGRYVVLASTNNRNSYKDQMFGYANIQITNLALLEFTSEDEHHYQVLNRNNGQPIEGARIHLRDPHGDANRTSVDEHMVTGKYGIATYKRKASVYSYNLQAAVNFQGDEASFGRFYVHAAANREPEDESTTARAFLFTDRSIYRPGQEIFFKGILIQTKKDKSSIVGGQYVRVYLEDANGEEVGTRRLKTNAFGSFSGEFKLPATGLTGEHTLYVDEDDEDTSRFYDNLDDFLFDEVSVSVEEYKRPTFEVTFDPVKKTFVLNDTVSIKGKAMAFSGAKLSKAKVKYTVTRKVQYPRWHPWSFRDAYFPAVAIAQGETLTDADGTFSIAFKAAADKKTSREEKPVFVFEIKVDATEISGETRNATTEVRVGYHTIMATINAPAQVDLVKPDNAITIVTENLNGEFVGISGKVEIFKQQAPTAPVRARPWEAPDLPILTREEFQQLFPHDTYVDVVDPKLWPRQKLMAALPFNTSVSKEIQYRIDKNWPSGNYIMELTAKDTTGEEVKDVYHFTVTDTKAKTVADNALLIFELDKPSYKVGEVAKLKVGSASPDATFFIHVEEDHKITKTYEYKFSSNTTVITLPITVEKENGFSVVCRGVVYNSFIYETINVPVVAAEREFEIETLTFKDKLQPGAKEMWSFSIKGDAAASTHAEVLASMYDASLDQFKPHQWYFQPNEKEQYFSTVLVSGNQSFGGEYFHMINLSSRPWLGGFQYYDKFDWFGFTLARNQYAQRAYLNRLYSTGSVADVPSKVVMRNAKDAKDGYIQGHIVDNEGKPLAGVNIIIKGTTTGTATDMDGNYVIEAGKNDVLVYSFIGYATAETRVGRKNTIDVVMEPDIMELSEVVVTAYGIQKQKKALAGSVRYIVAEATDSDVEFVAALEGRVPGVQIQNDGLNYFIKIRGASSVSSEKPMYVVDGKIVASSTLDNADLADVQVLKGVAATTLYGAKASNGVIVITTKSGQRKLDEELAKVNVRKNFNETAFFFPHLSTNEDGDIRFSFTTPESLTRWKLQLLAHTRDLLTTTKTLQAVTQKQLMVTPNMPRFVRVGDEITLTVRVSNLSGRKLDGKIGLQLSDAVTGKSVDVLFSNAVRNKTFKINGNENTSVSWIVRVPEGIDALQYRVVAKAGNFSDGEQNALPVLSNRMLVTETLPLFVRSSQTKTFQLDKLRDSKSTTLKHHRLTLEVTSNPAWYGVQALPYLMEFPHECAEQLFSRYYSNALAKHIINSDIKIKAVVEKWSSLGQLQSNLEKNSELKSLLIEETPWLRDAVDETEQRKRLALLFDLNNMRDQQASVLNKLEQMQFADGGFPWFAGGRYPNRYITQHVASTYGHLKKLHVADYDDEKKMIEKAVKFLDREFVEGYERLLYNAEPAATDTKTHDEKKPSRDEYLLKYHPTDDDIHYLYMRSFYPELPVDGRLKEGIAYYQKQSAQFWQTFSLYGKGMIALVHHRSGNTSIAKDILTSLRENAIISEEFGMYWKENTGGMYWNQAAVETQALLIEAFAEIESGDGFNTTSRKTIDELRLWLLRHKQTNQWKTTKETTEAIYALLLNGTDWLTLNDAVDVTVGKEKVLADDQQSVESASGYFKTSWTGETIAPDKATITFSKKGEGVAWGELYWQYFEDLDKITPAATPLKLTKKLFVVTNDERGERLSEINGVELKLGDRLRVRIELSTDRPMEFVHMKDMRAAGLEPVDVLSEYKWQENLGYYQSTRDAATHFFFDYIPKGVYVFEYDLLVNNKGDFSNGITSIQSMYAPEFGSHSDGVRIEVR